MSGEQVGICLPDPCCSKQSMLGNGFHLLCDRFPLFWGLKNFDIHGLLPKRFFLILATLQWVVLGEGWINHAHCKLAHIAVDARSYYYPKITSKNEAKEKFPERFVRKLCQ